MAICRHGDVTKATYRHGDVTIAFAFVNYCESSKQQRNALVLLGCQWWAYIGEGVGWGF